MKNIIPGLVAAGVLLAAWGGGSSHSSTATTSPTTTAPSGPHYFLGNTPANLAGEKFVPTPPSEVCSQAFCYGDLVTNDNGSQPLVSAVTTTGGLISAYTEAFADNSSLVDAENYVLSGLPPDTSGFGTSNPTESGGCGIATVTSPTIGKLSALSDPTGTITIALSYVDSNGQPAYDPSNVQQAEVVAGTSPNC